MLKLVKSLFSFSFLIFGFAIFILGLPPEISAQKLNAEDVKERLNGEWIAEEDPKSKWVFTGNELHRYYDGDARPVRTFSVTEECKDEEAQELDEGMLFAPSESGADICAAIMTLSEERLTLMFIPSGRLGLLMREDESDH